MIDFASRQRGPRKHVIGLTAVVVLHGLLFWAINSGLARKFVKVIKGPVEAVLLEETKPEIPPRRHRLRPLRICRHRHLLMFRPWTFR